MHESGGSRNAFLTDPLQVNKPGDWVSHKHQLLGLTKHQKMTPEISAYAALKWLQYKGWHHDGSGKADYYRGDDAALNKYNGKDPQYAAKVDALLKGAIQARRPPS